MTYAQENKAYQKLYESITVDEFNCIKESDETTESKYHSLNRLICDYEDGEIVNKYSGLI